LYRYEGIKTFDIFLDDKTCRDGKIGYLESKPRDESKANKIDLLNRSYYMYNNLTADSS